ncbi:MAG: major capsid protein, partial [Plesiomonas sp.]
MSMYTTRKLLAATQQKFKFDQLFLRLFFRETYTFDTEEVNLAKIPGAVNMAVYVSPTVSGQVLRTRGGLRQQFKPGYVKPKHEVTPSMVVTQLVDEDPQNLNDPEYRRKRLILQNLKDEELAIQQIEERQAVDAVLFGSYIMKGDDFEPVEVDMQRS